jgi:hypothetical protein
LKLRNNNGSDYEDNENEKPLSPSFSSKSDDKI